MDKENLSELMREKAEKIQAVVSDVSSVADVFNYTLELTRNQGGKTIAAPGFAPADLETLGGLCTKEDIQLLEPPFRNNLEGIHTGLTFADWGIAETGTLVMDSAREDLRIVTMLSEIHVAALPKAAIYPDTDALALEMDAIFKARASYLAFISGPSRTADIERVLSIGVHGPRQLHILLMDHGGGR